MFRFLQSRGQLMDTIIAQTDQRYAEFAGYLGRKQGITHRISEQKSGREFGLGKELSPVHDTIGLKDVSSSGDSFAFPRRL